MSQAKLNFIESFVRFKNDPYGFVLYSFEWGKEGTFLANADGPDDWQIDVMETLRVELERREHSHEETFSAIQFAVASGHGVGKTSLVAWLVYWFICTRPNPQIVVTAGTQSQLETKTWRELSKWHGVSMQKEWFVWTATKFYMKEEPETWFASALPWSVHKSDSFAGTHEKYVLYVFDEASAIDDLIWEVSEGAMTTENCIWLAFGNPVRNTGRFKACFGKYAKWWITRKVDSRSAKMANKTQIEQWKDQYGEDSDFFRKRVRGEFPVQSSNQLIPEEFVLRCREFQAIGYETFPVRITCDVARFGEDSTVIAVVQGRKVHEIWELQKKDTVQSYSKIIECYNYWIKKQDSICVFVDDIGVGGGVTDMLKHARVPVIGVNSGARPNDPITFMNIRVEMWFSLAEAVKDGLDMSSLSKVHFDRIKDDLINIEYFQQPSTQKYQLESVDSLKRRDLPSPDFGTALALSLAQPVPHKVQSSRDRFTNSGGGLKSTARKRGVR